MFNRILRLCIWGLSGVKCLTACTDNIGPGRPTVTHIRVVNGLFQATATDTTPVAIDYLLDSLTSAPSVMNLAEYAVSSGDSASGYQLLGQGVHSFVARRAGDTAFASSIYTTSTDLPYLPKQYLPGGTYNTVIVAGVIPATGRIPNNTIPFTLFTDDPFPGPEFSHTLQARFHVIHAAAFVQTPVLVYVTPGATPPANISAYTWTAAAFYRGDNPSLSFANVDVGQYTVTFVNYVNGTILAQRTVTFDAGDVRTLILLSTGAGVPSQANHTVLNLLDHHYTQ